MLIFTPQSHQIVINKKRLESHQWELLELKPTTPKRHIQKQHGGGSIVTEEQSIMYEGCLYLYPHTEYAREMEAHNDRDGSLVVETTEYGTMKKKKFEGIISSQQNASSYSVSLISD